MDPALIEAPAAIVSGASTHPDDTRSSLASMPPIAREAHAAYRADIDGLRAVAIVAVVLFHSGWTAMQGGYLGVDVFFVISGFLIAGIIAEALAGGRFTFAWFYSRRVRRLLPAWAVVATATTLASLALLLPADLAFHGKALAGSSLFSTNVVFWREAGYFAGPSAVKPLLHSWSLSVEEQFYLVFPALMLLLLRFGRRIGARILAGLLVLSLAAALVVVERWPTAAFFLLPFRAWELLIGAVLAVGMDAFVPGVRSARMLAWSGALVLLAALVLGRPADGFPSPAAIAACVATAALIASGRNATAVRSVLSARPMAFVGNLSYSWYLWHWPALALLAYAVPTGATPAQVAATIVGSFLVAAASWRWIEAPFRDRTRTPRFAPALAVVVVGMASLATGAWLYLARGLPDRLDARVLALAEQGRREPACTHGPGALSCVVGARASARPAIALWGDSHAMVVPASLARVAGDGIVLYGEAGCPPVPGVRRTDHAPGADCATWADAVVEEVARRSDLRSVVLVARHAAYLLGPADRLGPAERHGGPTLRLVGMGDDLWSGYFQAMEAAIARIQASGKRVIMVLPIPEVGFDVPRSAANSVRWGQGFAFLDRPVAAYDARQARVREALLAVAGRRKVDVVDPRALFCGSGVCRAARGDRLYYSDDDHLAGEGARMLAVAIARTIDETPPR
jgi:peptidoglycan/LPS O-acetylase OafA/YrhL